MAKIFTIQNDDGDRGWIQIIENNEREIDEVQDYSSKFNPEYKHNYIVISEEDYRIVLDCHKRYQITEKDHYLDIIDIMTTALLTAPYELMK